MQAMKNTIILINTARGGLINERDLVTAIQQELIGSVGLDVAEYEPIRADSPLLEIIDLPNVLVTPHIAWTSDQAMNTQAQQMINNIEALVRGESLNRVV
jgi:glycerate dehydrogenase